MKIYEDNSMSIGNTPLIRLNKIGSGNILAKIEGRNPAYSVKCRVGASMVWEAEKQGLLRPGMEIIEPTSGNTGIALAYVGAARGYQVTLVMPESMSIERRKVMAAFGAKLILTDAAKGMKGAIDKADELYLANKENMILLQQFDNPANPLIHEKTTGPEIWADTDGEIDIFVAGVGTGGTITGVSRFIKAKKKIMSIAVEPESSAVISQTISGNELKPAPHKIQGIGAGFIPNNLDVSIIDVVVSISDDEAIEYAHRLMKEEGILAGISGGAAVAAAEKISQVEGNQNKMIVTVIPDSGERYLTSALFES